MHIIGLDGNTYNWSIGYHKNKLRKNSELHNRARKILKEIFPYDVLIEEISLPGTGKQKPLIADFYIHSQRKMFEVQGEQHYKHVSYFHPTKLDFLYAQTRDKNKKEWCELNDIELIELPFGESDDEWRKRINKQ